ncbi:MAG: phosphatase PAP2 family protein [Bacteroidota bacterium]|nr:phosphatase PAP2 family protein [Kiloniellaceae bacterium]
MSGRSPGTWRSIARSARVRELAPAALARLGLRELSLLVFLCLAAGGVWLFVEIADEVADGELEGFDSAILLSLRSPTDLHDPLGPPWFEEMVRDVTALGGNLVTILITLASAGYLALQRKGRAALFVLLAVSSGILLGSTLKGVFERPRPDLVEHAMGVYTSSFPSGHAMTAGVVYLTLAAVLMRFESRRRLKLYLLSLAVLVTLAVGASRVYLGVHWPSDVIAGWAAGAAWAMLWWCAALWMQRKGAVEEVAESSEALPP